MVSGRSPQTGGGTRLAAATRRRTGRGGAGVGRRGTLRPQCTAGGPGAKEGGDGVIPISGSHVTSDHMVLPISGPRGPTSPATRQNIASIGQERLNELGTKTGEFRVRD